MVVSGLPVIASAKTDCPMAQMMKSSNEQMASMPDCGKMAQESKSGCCDDNTCNTQCSVSGGVNMVPASNQAELYSFMIKTPRARMSEVTLASQLLNTQDRPPKFLS